MRWTTGQPCLSAVVQARRLSLLGHIAWMPDETNTKKIITASPLENWKRPPERPRTTWMKTIQQDLKSNNLSPAEAINVAQNHPLWRLMSAFGTTHPQWCMPQKEKKIIWSQHSNFWEIYAVVAIPKSGWSLIEQNLCSCESLIDWQEDKMFCSMWQWENVAQSELWKRCSVSHWSAGNKEPRDDYAELLPVALVAVSKGDLFLDKFISLHLMHIIVPGGWPRDCIAWRCCVPGNSFRWMHTNCKLRSLFVYNNAVC